MRHPPGGQAASQADQQGIAPGQGVTLAVTPPADNQIRHHQDQRSALRQRLLHAETKGQHGNGDDPAADAEQAAKKAEAGTQNKHGEKFDELMN